MSGRAYTNISPDKEELLELPSGAHEICDNAGIEVCSLRHSSDPDGPDLSTGEVVEARVHPLSKADLVITYIGTPSWEIDADLQDAVAGHKDIIVLYEKGRIIGDLLSGIPRIIEEIAFDNIKEALSRLEVAILKWQHNFVVHGAN